MLFASAVNAREAELNLSLRSSRSATELRPLVVPIVRRKWILRTAISILDAPPFCHGSARSCPTTPFLNNFGFAESHQVGHITACKRVNRPSLTMLAVSSLFSFLPTAFFLFLHTSPFTPASGLVRFLSPSASTTTARS
jgi:hypothetical protein